MGISVEEISTYIEEQGMEGVLLAGWTRGCVYRCIVRLWA